MAGILTSSLGCWEQVSKSWFAQMKEQPAVQALEGTQPLMPPDGTIPVGGIEPRIDSPVPAFMPEAMALQNPIAATDASRARGKQVYDTYCAICHGDDGMAGRGADGSAAEIDAAELPAAFRLAKHGMAPPPLKAVPAYTDGFLFTKIRYGKPQMPGYPQIPPEDRWHLVNYLRSLIQGG
ncbi:MAG: c-type cytochrome [Myxococcota bacterium]